LFGLFSLPLFFCSYLKQSSVNTFGAVACLLDNEPKRNVSFSLPSVCEFVLWTVIFSLLAALSIPWDWKLLSGYSCCTVRRTTRECCDFDSLIFLFAFCFLLVYIRDPFTSFSFCCCSDFQVLSSILCVPFWFLMFRFRRSWSQFFDASRLSNSADASRVKLNARWFLYNYIAVTKNGKLFSFDSPHNF
jgi:hypothetical protein